MISLGIRICKNANLNKDKEFIMVKKIAIGLLCTVLGSSLYARDDISLSKPFLGLEIGYATLNADALNYFGNGIPYADWKSSDVEYGVRIGAQKSDWRTMLIYNYFDTKKDDYAQTYHKGLLSIDYMFSFSETEASAFQPYLGLNVGYISYKTGDTPYTIDASGFIYGGQIGFTYNVAEKIDIDLMYRYSLGGNVSDENWSDRNRVKNIGSVILGINYLY